MAIAEHVNVARRGKEALAAWRRDSPGEVLDLRNADLQGAQLAGADLHGARLRRANLAGADLSDCMLSDANLGGANLAFATLKGSLLKNCHLQGANLTHSNLTRADLCRADLRRTILQEAILEYACLASANLRRAMLLRTNLRHANLRSADMSREDLKRDDQLFSDLHLPDRPNADGRASSMRPRDPNPGALLLADLTGADLRGVNLQGALLYGVVLESSNLVDADLRRTKLRGVVLGDADLTSADLREAEFDGGDLQRTVLHRCDLRGASFRNRGHNGVDLRLTKADVSGAIFGQTEDRHTEFDGVDLSGCLGLSRATFDGRIEIDFETIERSGGSLPRVLLEAARVGDETSRALAQDHRVAITFAQPDPRFPAMVGLALGDVEYSIQKNSGSIVLTLAREGTEEALAAALQMLARIEQSFPGAVERLELSPDDGGLETLSQPQLGEALSSLGERLQQIEQRLAALPAPSLEPHGDTQTPKEELVVELARSIPYIGRVVGLAVKRSLERARDGKGPIPEKWRSLLR